MPIIVYVLLLAACIVALIANTHKKKNKTVKKKSEETSILPYADYDIEYDCICYKDLELYMDILQVRTKDLYNASEDMITFDVIRMTQLFRKYAGDLKIIATNFPSDTKQQQEYIKYKIKHTKNAVNQKWLKKKLKELEYIENNRTNREFYLMFWGSSKDEIVKNREMILTSLGKGIKDSGLVECMEFDKKLAILRKLNNKSSKIILEKLEKTDEQDK